MRSDNATQNAMQCKCSALRRIAVRKLPRCHHVVAEINSHFTVVIGFVFLLVWSQYLLKLTPFLGGFLVFIG